MDNWLRAASLPATADLAALSGLLHQRGIAHRISEERGRQIIWVTSPAAIEPLNELLNKIESGEIRIEANPAAGAGPRSLLTGLARSLFTGLERGLGKSPVTFTLLGLSVLGFIVSGDRFDTTLLHWLTFQDFVVRGRALFYIPVADSLANGELWRLITPIFLHFGIFHIVFNGLWVWEFGRRIEALIGSARFIGLVLLVGIVSNVAQFLWESRPPFGGMSGVIYALLGYIWQRHRLAPAPALAIPRGVIGFMLVWLVLCMVGTVTWLARVNIANGAHLGGLLAGMACGILAGSNARRG